VARATRTSIVLTGGDPVSPALADRLPVGATVVAADSGLGSAARLGLSVDLLVGDLDSVDPVVMATALDGGTELERHPVAKDRTDLAIALDAAGRLGADHIVVVGGHGGRLDHLLGNALLLASDVHAERRIEAFMGAAHVVVVRDEATLTGVRGELVSLLPVHGGARGVTTEGLLYPLVDEDLPAGSTRGVSNELTGTSARVALVDGVLLAVLPGAMGTHVRTGVTPDLPDRS
jgi:thiamine pyrophosphokinase